MKKTLLLLAGLSLFACSSSDNGDSNENQNPNPSTGTKGKLKSVETPDDYIDENGNQSTFRNITTFDYGNNGFVSKTRSVDRDGIDYSTVFNYEGNKLIGMNYTENGVVTSGTNYTYSGNLIIKSVSIEDKYTDVREYFYNNSNELIKEVYSVNGRESSISEYTYSNGNIVTEKIIYTDGQHDAITRTYQYDNKKNPSSIIFTEAYLKIHQQGKNNIIKENDNIITYEYNSGGYPTKKIEGDYITNFQYY